MRPDMHVEEHGSGGTPLVLLHGGIAGGEIFEEIAPRLAERRRVIVPDLQGHGRTADIDRPLRAEHLADDVAALIEQLGLGRADVMGYSLGGVVALRTAIQHPERVRRLVLVSVGFSRDGSHPEVVQNMDQFSPELAPMLQQSPLYERYARLAPRVEDWPVLIAKTADMLHADYDWRAEAEQLQPPAMLVFADADSVRPAHIVEFFGVLGGGLRDANWDGSLRPTARLAILPGTTHYDVYASPALAPAVGEFLDAEL
jgi:pimeloyl-ACP methyl ester carboxylesterase